MKDITFLASLFFPAALFFCSAIAIYQLWFICHYNGRVLFYYISALTRPALARLSPARLAPAPRPTPTDASLSMAAVCVVGLMPIAFLSLATAVTGRCFNSLYATLVLEFAITTLYLFIPSRVKKGFDLFGIQAIQQHPTVFFCGLLWCLSFAAWATLNHTSNLDYMIANTNPDMWAYVRRIAAFTTNNLSFYGGADSFTFRDESACAFLIGSPKKLSSFLGSLISYPFQGSSLGIAVFQSTLGGALLLCLFWEWMETPKAKNRGISAEKILAIAWVLSSPPLYWLMISAYFSNALFVIITALTLREARRTARLGWIKTPINFVFFFSVLAIVLAFYPAFIPVITLVYIGTLGIYMPRLNLKEMLRLALVFMGFAAVCGLVFYLLFPSQLGLEEVSKSLNFTREHGSNFVPLNPWSLVQEKPKPMASTKDFGLYLNIILGLVFSGLLGRKLIHLYRQDKNRDLLAGLVGLGFYSSYLLAHIPLSSTYRLMKLAISVVYPLAIFGLLPLLLQVKMWLTQKSIWLRGVVASLMVLHIALHIEKTFDLNPFPSGSFVLANPNRLETVASIAIVGCKDVHSSQFYERLVGLQLARRYPHTTVNVFRSPEHLNAKIQSDLTLFGEIVPHEEERKQACRFSV